MLRPAATLTIDGRTFADAVELHVERDMDHPAHGLRARLARPLAAAPGAAVSLRLADGSLEAEVFAGSVLACRPGLEATWVEALGGLRPLVELRVAVSYDGETPGAVAHDLARRAGLAPGEITQSAPQLPRYTLDARRSAYAHLRDLADRLGLELYADCAGRLMFHQPAPAAGLELAFGRHLLAATAARRAEAWGRVVVGGESPMSGRGEDAADWLTARDQDYRGEAGDHGPELLVVDALARTRDLADTFARGRLAVARRRERELHLEAPRLLDLDLGGLVTLAAVPDGLPAGAGYVRALTITCDARRGLRTRLRVTQEHEL